MQRMINRTGQGKSWLGFMSLLHAIEATGAKVAVAVDETSAEVLVWVDELGTFTEQQWERLNHLVRSNCTDAPNVAVSAPVIQRLAPPAQHGVASPSKRVTAFPSRWSNRTQRPQQKPSSYG